MVGKSISWKKYFLEKVELECWIGERIEVQQEVTKKKSVLRFRDTTFAMEGKDKKQGD